MYCYTVEVLRNEAKEITGYKCLARTSQPMKFRAKETEVAFSNEEIDPDFVTVTVGEDGGLIASLNSEAQLAAQNMARQKLRREFGGQIIDLMSLRNEAKEFTPEQVVTFATTYATINSALLNGSIATAKALIEAIEPDGVITTEADKTAVLGEIEANEARLGYAP